MGLGVLTPRPGRFTFAKENQCPLYRMCGPQFRFGWVRKISRPPGFDPRTVQPVASGYTECITPGHHYLKARRNLSPPTPTPRTRSFENYCPFPGRQQNAFEDTACRASPPALRALGCIIPNHPISQHWTPFTHSLTHSPKSLCATCGPIPLRNTNLIAFPVLIYDMPFTFT